MSYGADNVGKKPHLRVHLIGRDGNAFAILGACKRAAQSAGWTESQLAAFQAQATSGNYDHLLAVVQEHFDIE